MTPEEARDEFAALVDETQAALGAEFEVRDDPTPLWCEMSDGREGVRYSFSRLGPAPADAGEAVDTVRELWEGRGYAVRETEVGPAIELATRAEHNAPIVFGASVHGMTVGGSSGCAPRTPAD